VPALIFKTSNGKPIERAPAYAPGLLGLLVIEKDNAEDLHEKSASLLKLSPVYRKTL
jgi:hypothetical protein